MIKAIAFDFFGVFMPDQYWLWLEENVGDLSARRQFFDDLANRIDQGTISHDMFLSALSKSTGISQEEIVREMNRERTIDYGLLSVAEHLRKQYKIAVVSNIGHEFLEKIFSEHDLHPYFDVVIPSSKFGVIKPNPAIFRILLEQLGMSAREVIFTDDRLKNVEGARAVGIDSFVYQGVADFKKNLRERGVEVE